MKKNNVYKFNKENELEFKILLNDRKAIQIINEIPEEKQQQFLSQSLAIGITALNSAINQADEAKLSDIAEELTKFFDEYKTKVKDEINVVFNNFIDPKDGTFEKRINNLIKGNEGDGGEIGRLISKQLIGPESPLEKGLDTILGPQSRLFKNLDPDSASGIVQAIKSKIEETLKDQNESIIQEFSLDKKDSALNRLILELKNENKNSGENFAGEVKKIQKLFSFDDENGIFLKFENKIMDEVKLIKDELLKINYKKQIESNTTIQGNEFEDKVFYFAQDKFSEKCEVEHVGNILGKLRRKVGDVLLTINSDLVGSGKKIVIEVKSDESYKMNKARQELKIAKENRDADIGIFVFEKSRKPDDLNKNLQREGKDIYVCWDPGELSSEAFLEASIHIAIALITQDEIQDTDQREYIDTIKATISTIEESIKSIDSVESSSTTIVTQAEAIKKYITSAKTNLNREIRKLLKLI